MKPQTKETAILMLVDSIEAASRTIDPPEREAFEDDDPADHLHEARSGQLDDSGLAIEDLRILANRMTDTLVNMHHHRVKYQWQAKKAEEFGVPSQTFARASSPEIEVHQSLFPANSSVPPAGADGQRADSPSIPRAPDPPVTVPEVTSSESSPEPVRTSATVPIEKSDGADKDKAEATPETPDAPATPNLPRVESRDRSGR